MNLKIFQETKPVTGANVLVGAIYLNSAPTVLVASFEYVTPYTGQTQLANFNDLVNAVYIYTCYESPDGSASGTIRNTFQVQPNNSGFNAREDLYLTADQSPFLASGTNFYGVDSSLPTWDWYLERKPQGTQKPAVDFNKTKGGVVTTNSDITADGFVLAQAGDVVNALEDFIIHFYPQAVAANAPPASAVISNTNLLTATTTLDLTAAGQAYLLQGAGGYFDVNLPRLSTVAPNKQILFISGGGSHINVGINCFAGDSFQWLSGTQTKIILGQDEQLIIYRFGTTWLISQISPTVKMVGDIVFGLKKLSNPNIIFTDGSDISKVNYARLAAYVSALVGTSAVVSIANWTNTVVINGFTFFINTSCFGWDNASSTFRLPRFYDTGFIRAVGAGAGLFVPYEVGAHSHEEQVYTALNNGGRKPVGFLNTDNDLDGSGVFTLDNDDTTGDNHPNNFGVYASIRY